MKQGIQKIVPTRSEWQRRESPSRDPVKAAQPVPFVEYRVPQPMLDSMAKCEARRAVGKSWRPEHDLQRN